jgi:ABC-type multidrug transport system ATPase subunit
MLDPNISVLVLDEPTSGLDAAAALNVCNVLRALADSAITIATSLHQPRSSIMALFDQLMILAAGRRIFYSGVANYLPY